MTIARLKTVALCSVLLLSPQCVFGHEPVVDEQAVAVLKAMEAHIGGLRSIEVRSESSADVLLGGGLLAEQATTSRMWISRPNRLRIARDGDMGPVDIFIADGLLTVSTPDKQYYAKAEVSRDVDEAVQYAVDVLEIDAPFFDLIYGETVEKILEEMDTVRHLGTTQVRGVTCDHLVLRNGEFDAQIFVASGDQPAPRKVVFTSKLEYGSPRYTAFLEWDVSPRIEDRIFRFTPSDEAREIKFTALVD